MKKQKFFSLFVALFLSACIIALLTMPLTAAAADIPDTITVSITTETGQTLSVTIGIKQTENGYRLVPLAVYNPQTQSFYSFFLSLPDTIPHSSSWGGIIVDEEILLGIITGNITLGGFLGPSRGVDPSGGNNDEGEGVPDIINHMV
jgi:hypothetical protein